MVIIEIDQWKIQQITTIEHYLVSFLRILGVLKCDLSKLCLVMLQCYNKRILLKTLQNDTK